MDTYWLFIQQLRRPFIFRVIMALALLTIPAMQVNYSGKSVSDIEVCDEATLDKALERGGLIQFKCNGTIFVTSTKIIHTDTILNATGYKVVITSTHVTPIFKVESGIRFRTVNITILSPGTDLPARSPATGYETATAPPSEWVLIGAGGMALVVVSLLGGIFTRYLFVRRTRRSNSQ